MNTPIARPQMPPLATVAPYLERMYRSGQFTNFGPLVLELETRYARMLQVDPRQVVTCANATLALAGSLQVLPRSSWLVPDWTFAATGHAVKMSGGHLQLRDVTPEDGLLSQCEDDDPLDSGVLPVAPFGSEIDLRRFEDWPVGVYDAAASLGTFPDLQYLRSEWAIVFSLHATKVLGCGEGGLAVFGSTNRADDFRRWSNFAFTRDRVSLFDAVNAKMAEVSAAYALAALDGWPTEQREWKASHGLVRSQSGSVARYFPPQWNGDLSPYWIAAFETAEMREVVQQALRRSGVETRLWWPLALSQMPAFAKESRTRTPVSEHLAATCLGLPMFRALRVNEARLIVDSLEDAITGGAPIGRSGP